MLRARLERFDVRVVGRIGAKRAMPGNSALKFFSRFLDDRFFQGIGATSGQDRARDANGGRKGFQALRIMGTAIHCKNFGMPNVGNAEWFLHSDFELRHSNFHD